MRHCRSVGLLSRATPLCARIRDFTFGWKDLQGCNMSVHSCWSQVALEHQKVKVVDFNTNWKYLFDSNGHDSDC